MKITKELIQEMVKEELEALKEAEGIWWDNHPGVSKYQQAAMGRDAKTVIDWLAGEVKQLSPGASVDATMAEKILGFTLALAGKLKPNSEQGA